MTVFQGLSNSCIDRS